MKKILCSVAMVVSIIACTKTKDDTPRVTPVQPAVPANDRTAKHNTFEATLSEVLKAFETKNDSLANTFVSPEHGVMIIYREGVFNEYKFIDKIEFAKPFPLNFPYPVIASNNVLKYELLPKFDCGSMKWDKYGLYCDTIRKDTLLSGTPQNLIKYRGDKINAAEVRKLKQLEAKGRRIVLAQRDKDFIFYLTLIDKKWYLTAIDRITTDCSA